MISTQQTTTPMADGMPVPQQQHQQQHQPQQQWMQAPQAIPGCPPGLEYLTQVDQLLVKQKVELMEMLTDFETKNKYKIKNSMGQDVYKAKEKTDCCQLQFCGPNRSFEMEITDNNGTEVLHLNRPLACSSCFFPCCLMEMTVTSPITGEVLGSIRQKWAILQPKFEICNGNGDVVLNLQGPICTISCFSDIVFDITTLDGTEVGKITKQWTGIVKESLTDADNFGVTFPLDLDARVKATLLGAVFLMDFMYFEEPSNNN